MTKKIQKTKKFRNIKKDGAQKIKRYILARHRFFFVYFFIIITFCALTGTILFTLRNMGFSFHSLRNPALVLWIICALCFILSYVTSYFLMNAIFSPLEKLSNASKQIAKGNYDVELSYHGHVAEIENVIHNFNFMVHELNSVEMMRNDFIANVSHEFKTPLSSITGYVTLLQDPELSEEERQEYIQMAFFNIEKLNDLTGNILQLSKLEHQNALNSPVTYRLDEQIREVLVLLEPKWSQKQIYFDINMQDITYTGQQALLFQVWSNLLGNAIKFSNPNGKISIQLKDSKHGIKVIISDEGIGMSEETLAHLFEKFYQGDSSRREQGNGLGLALCKNILDKCNGKIYVSSTLGHGSAFMVVLQ